MFVDRVLRGFEEDWGLISLVGPGLSSFSKFRAFLTGFGKKVLFYFVVFEIETLFFCEEEFESLIFLHFDSRQICNLHTDYFVI